MPKATLIASTEINGGSPFLSSCEKREFSESLSGVRTSKARLKSDVLEKDTRGAFTLFHQELYRPCFEHSRASANCIERERDDLLSPTLDYKVDETSTQRSL